ncbi:MAG: peptidyl-prolyl cis-trans isomerase [Thermoleophilia bacterium]|nr:peptidyl-prolyl cis-trans isomerase [Thermoleophilia bacterium]
MISGFRAVSLIMAGLFGTIAIAGLAGCGSLPDDAAASVNGEIITKAEVADRIDNLRKVYSAMIPSEEDEAGYGDLRREVADQLVREELERQETEKRGITVSEAEIDERMEYTAEEKFLGDTVRMIEEFEGMGISVEQMRDDIRRTILHEKMEADIGKDIQVTDEDARDYYERNIGQYVQPERRQVRQIITSDEADAAAAVSRLRAGEDMLQLVSEISIDETAAARRGALGLVSPGQLAPELDQAISGLGNGEISDPVRLGEQWYVFKVENIIPAMLRSFEDVRNEIIVIYGGQLYSQKWREFVSEVYDNASIKFDKEYDPAFKKSDVPNAPVK